MRFRAWRNLSDPYRAAVEGHSPWAAGARDPQPIVSGDVAGRSGDGLLPAAVPGPSRSARSAFIPLVGGGRLIGKFMVYYTRPRELTAQELELARAIANHVAAAVLRFRSLAELQQTVHLNETFAGILGHDLRNPLAAIITSARLAMNRAENDRLEKPLSRILSSSDRMTRMIDQLLDFTRVRLGGGIPIVPTELDLLPVVRQVIDELDGGQSRLRRSARRAWAIRSGTGTRTGCRSCSRTWSPTPFSMVSRTGGVAVTVDGRAADSVRVAVHNRGAHPDRPAPHAVRADGRAADAEVTGLGLGLFITRELVRVHGGSIDVSSDETAGTTFTVVLPRRCRSGARRPCAWRRESNARQARRQRECKRRARCRRPRTSQEKPARDLMRAMLARRPPLASLLLVAASLVPSAPARPPRRPRRRPPPRPPRRRPCCSPGSARPARSPAPFRSSRWRVRCGSPLGPTSYFPTWWRRTRPAPSSTVSIRSTVASRSSPIPPPSRRADQHQRPRRRRRRGFWWPASATTAAWFGCRPRGSAPCSPTPGRRLPPARPAPRSTRPMIWCCVATATSTSPTPTGARAPARRTPRWPSTASRRPAW